MDANQNFQNQDFKSLDQLRLSLDKYSDVSSPDFISVLEEHHDFIEDSVKVLTDPQASASDKQFHLARFLSLVAMHGRAEEETLYEALQDSESMTARVEGFGGQDEHDIAYQLADELEELDFENTWSDGIAAKAKVLASLLQNHIKEEESVMFKVAKEALDADARAELAADYLERCRVYLDQELSYARVERKDSPSATY